jgi:hypothetical protein
MGRHEQLQEGETACSMWEVGRNECNDEISIFLYYINSFICHINLPIHS